MPGPDRRTPDAIESILQLAKDGGRADQQQDDAEERGRQAFAWSTHALEQALHRERARGAQHAFQLTEDFAARGLVAEEKSGDRNHDQQQRCDREHRVVGERRAHALGVVIDPT